MPLVDRRSPLTSMNARASDVAAHTVEQVMPIQQQRLMAAFRVQGLKGILYSYLRQGMRCTCHLKDHAVAELNDDGKASDGAINRVLTGHTNFGISDYSDRPSYPDEEFDTFGDDETSPNNEFNKWLGDLNTSKNHLSDFSEVNDDGQNDGDLDLPEFDLGDLGLSDASCPICFGSTYVGGYSMMRGFRKVFVPSEMRTASTLALPKFELTPGTHTMTLTVPAGVKKLDVFRAMLNRTPVAAEFSIDGVKVQGRHVARMVADGRPHILEVTTKSNITHVEIQFATSDEPMYFELPRRNRSADMSLLEQQDPFQVIVSPEIPEINAMDIIVESQMGKHLLVTSVNPWETRARSMLGHEVQVRVVQPQELYTILPMRDHVVQKTQTAQTARVAKSQSLSGILQTRTLTF